jgi:hypothetical protein
MMPGTIGDGDACLAGIFDKAEVSVGIEKVLGDGGVGTGIDLGDNRTTQDNRGPRFFMPLSTKQFSRLRAENRGVPCCAVSVVLLCAHAIWET